jgi:hypothetical protein
VWFQVYEHVADRREGGEQPIFDSMTETMGFPHRRLRVDFQMQVGEIL